MNERIPSAAKPQPKNRETPEEQGLVVTMSEGTSIGLGEARPGHVLAGEICLGNGIVVLAKGATLTDSIIVRLKHIGVQQIEVLEEGAVESKGVEEKLAELDQRFQAHCDSAVMMEIRDAIAQGLCGDGPCPPCMARKRALPGGEPTPPPDEAEASRLRERIIRMLRLQTMPESVARVSRILDDPSCTAADVSRELSRDPALASQVLKLINSGFYGLSERISSLSHATALLGSNTLKTVLLSASINNRMKGTMESLWAHSVACSRVSGLLSRTLGVDFPEEVCAAGLLHDIGKSVLFECAPEAFERVVHVSASQDLSWIDAERDTLGLTHTETASLLLKKWNLPDVSVNAIACHHHPCEAGEHAPRASLLHLADVLVRARGVGSSGDRHVPAIHPTAMEVVGLSIEGIRPIISEMEQAVKDL